LPALTWAAHAAAILRAPWIGTMRTPEPILVVDLFPTERAALLDLLGSLEPGAWARETVCAGWAVRDIAAHLVADDLGRLSRDRDDYRPTTRRDGEELVAFINRQNAEWVRAMGRLSPDVITTLLRVGGGETQGHFEALDPFAMGGPVSWATGDEPAPVWLDLAREFTERWHHQQQIRDAVDAPPLTDPQIFGPVIATFAHALPRTFQAVEHPQGTAVTLVVTGESGGAWSIVRDEEAWRLFVGRPDGPAAAEVELSQDDYWRLATKGMTPAAAEARSRLSGDREAARHLLTTVAIIA
jgi:uncharacterized protein (TIGR03083 family)